LIKLDYLFYYAYCLSNWFDKVLINVILMINLCFIKNYPDLILSVIIYFGKILSTALF